MRAPVEGLRMHARATAMHHEVAAERVARALEPPSPASLAKMSESRVGKGQKEENKGGNKVVNKSRWDAPCPHGNGRERRDSWGA